MDGTKTAEKEREIYFDHAATTPLDKEALEEMLPYFGEKFGNPDSPHGAGRRATAAVDRARDTLAELIGAKSSEIYFTSGGTESDNWAVLGGARTQKEKGRTKVFLSSVEHHAALAAGARLEKEGFSVTYLPVNGRGRVEPNTLKAFLDEAGKETALVGVMTANNETGTIQPTEELAALTHEKGGLFFTDAVQAAPYLPIDVKKMDADMLSLSAHKFYGPKGIGALYVRGGVKIDRLIVGGEQQRGLRGGTLNVPSIVGLAAAYRKSVEGRVETNAKIRALKESFIRLVRAEISDVAVNGGGEETLPGIVNLRFPDVDNAALLYNLDLRGVAVSAGAACASASVEPSHVLLAMGLSEEEARSSLRFSFGRDNTEEEIAVGARLTAETVRRLRRLGGKS